MYLEPYELDRLTDMVFESNMSTREMGIELGIDEKEVKKQIRDLGLSWVRRSKGHVSRGQASLMKMMEKLLPGEKIAAEHPIGERLRLDVFCPSYNLAAEYHGRQHFFYVPHFHGDKTGFYEAKQRDERKVEICKDLGIALVVFRYNDLLTEDSVYNRMLYELENSPMKKEEKKISAYRGNPFYENNKERQREYRRRQYQKMKGLKGRA